MYKYTEFDQKIVDQRVEQYRDQTQRYLQGQITEQQFLPLRLQNGLYVQRLAPMLRICVPYGCISSKQLRQISYISRHYDKGYIHLTTRQNIQINWPALEEVPDILADLAAVQMHAIQTSGNCIRNFTSDPFAGVALDELIDPRPYCELLRHWATLHPEFAFLPRKFKIAVTASDVDRAAILAHDIGIKLIEKNGEVGCCIYVGGGLGRTPIIASKIYDFIPLPELIRILNSILRVYNLHGRRDNKYKARIKILVKALGVDKFRDMVDEQYALEQKLTPELKQADLAAVTARFVVPKYQTLDALEQQQKLQQDLASNQVFNNWYQANCYSHKVKGYQAMVITVKEIGVPTGDMSAEQLDAVADLADKYSFGQMVLTHEQNIVFTDVRKQDVYKLWQQTLAINLNSSLAETAQDMICCPGGDFCSLANAKSIPVAEDLQRLLQKYAETDLGKISINISGCMNACGHHHIGNIGILGVDKKGQEWYQIQLGGRSDENARVGKILGPSFAREKVPAVIEQILQVFNTNRKAKELFIDTYERVGIEPFKQQVYAK